MVKKISHAAGVVVAFLRRKLEVWFVLAMIAGMGIFGWLVLNEIESTQDALCRSAHSSAATKDRFVDVLARVSGRAETDGTVIELRRYVDEERANLAGECRTPNQAELVPESGGTP